MVTVMNMKDLLSTGDLVNCCATIAAGDTPDVAHDSIGEFLWELALKLYASIPKVQSAARRSNTALSP